MAKTFEEEMNEYANETLGESAPGPAPTPEAGPEPEPKDENIKNYEFEMFLSTDGKHTVHIKVTDPASRREAMQKAIDAYEYVLARFGTKQAQAVKEYGNGRPAQAATDPNCQHTQVKFFEVKKEGPNKGRWFKSCANPNCKKFLSWQ